MNIRTLVLTSLLTANIPALAQHSHRHAPVQSGSSAIRIEDATLYTTQPGATTGTWKFIVTWTSATPPTTFFWRPEGDRWMTASVKRVRGFISQDKTPVYKTEVIDLKNIRRGDMIEITPMAMGRDVMPAAAKSKPAGRLYFQRKGSNTWETAYPGEIHRILNVELNQR